MKNYIVQTMLKCIRSGDHPILDYATEQSLSRMYDSYKKDKNKRIILQDDKKGFMLAVIGYCLFNDDHFVAYEVFHFSENGKKQELIEKLKTWALYKDAIAIQIGHGINSRDNHKISKRYTPLLGDPMGYVYVERL